MNRLRGLIFTDGRHRAAYNVIDKHYCKGVEISWNPHIDGSMIIQDFHMKGVVQLDEYIKL